MNDLTEQEREELKRKAQEAEDANKYFVKSRLGIWSARLPVLEGGWKLYRDDPIIQHLSKNWLGRLGYFLVGYAAIIVLGLIAREIVPEISSLVWVAFLGIFAMSARLIDVIDTMFLQIEAGNEVGEFGYLSNARKNFLKMQTRALFLFVNLIAGLIYITIVQLTLAGGASC